MTSAAPPLIDEAALAVFNVIPTPVSIFDRETLRILAVNESTAQELDRSTDELLQMTIADLRAPENLQALKDAVEAISAPVTDAGRWRLRTPGGGILKVNTRWRPVSFRGHDAVLATWHDISSFRAADEEDVSVSRERAVPPKRAEATARLYRALFEAAPGKMLVMKPENYEIIAASDAFFVATKTSRDEITGQHLFDVFPDNPAEPDADGVRNLRASLLRVERRHEPDVMSVQRYPIRRSESDGGGFEERYWAQVNAPILDAEGKLVYIIHRTEDVTEIAQSGAEEKLQPLEMSRRNLVREVLLRSQEMGRANILFQEQAARIRTAERLLDLGTWSYDFETRSLEWSDRVRELYGVPPDQPVPDFDGYVDLVHPEDREAMVATYRDFEESDATHFTFQHRILRPGGKTVHVKGVGERHRVDGRDQVVGFVEDITQYVAAMERLSQATGLMRMAGERAKLGGWRVDLGSGRVHWTDETAAIHEESVGKQPTLDEALSYYAPEAQDIIRQRFEACAHEGEDFDEVLQLDTAKGNRIWVRAMGEPVRGAHGTIVAVQGAFQDISEIVEARRGFAAVSRQLRETLENMGDAFFTLDQDWNLTFVNKQAELLLDRRRDELIGSNVWEAFPDARGSTFQKEYVRVRSEQTTGRFTEFFPPLEKWFRVNVHPAPNGIAVYFNDVTEERAREEQLRLLDAAVSRLNDIVLITEAAPIDAPAGPRVVYANNAVEHTTGYSREEILGSTPRILQGPGTDRAELDRIRSALEQAQPIRSEILNYTRSGEPYWLELDIVPLADKTGALTHFVAVERDITERKRTEEAIRVRDERFRLLSSATNDVIWDWDLETDEIWWNAMLSTLFGHDREGIEPGIDSWKSRIHPDERDQMVQSIHDAIAGSGTKWVGEYRFLRADGTARLVIDRASIIRDEAGKAVRMLGSMVDVTDQRELEARYHQAQKLEAVGQLTGGVAHDFNNLLTVILGNAEILAEEVTEPGQRSLAEMMAKAAERGAELTSRLLTFSRRQALAPRRLDINRQIGGMEALLRRTLRENIELSLVTDPDLWAVEADPAQLESAILNLVVNAQDAMPDGGRLTIETANVSFDDGYARHQAEVRAGPYVMITITDSGTGMSPEVVEHAFEPFFTTKDVGSGSGLGLSMVYGFAKQSGGHVSIYSEPGYGTTVKLYLPRPDIESEMFQPGPPPETVRGGAESILVVEDDEMVRRHLVAQLGSLGYLVASAASAPEALELLRGDDARFDLLLTDVIMPGGMNGRELAETALAEMPGLRVLFSSGYSENTIVHNGRLDEGVQLLTKPYRRDDLARKIRLVLDGPETS